MDILTKEELAFFSNAPMTPLRFALTGVTVEARKEIEQAKSDHMRAVERLNEDDDGEGTLFPPEILAQIDRIKEMLGTYGENALTAYKFTIKAPYDLPTLQTRSQGTGADVPPPKCYCDYRIVAGSTFKKDVVRIPTYVRDALVNKYKEPSELTGKTIAQWLQSKPYAFQRDYGISAMRDLGIIK